MLTVNNCISPSQIPMKSTAPYWSKCSKQGWVTEKCKDKSCNHSESEKNSKLLEECHFTSKKDQRRNQGGNPCACNRYTNTTKRLSHIFGTVLR
mmetsp:Transcript_31290/g.61999  ORF Transcript_31290/g.61999 Transcript_31290/m.61999 type:complete len:94 (-) Transcript_31290:3416-3697(-)